MIRALYTLLLAALVFVLLQPVVIGICHLLNSKGGPWSWALPGAIMFCLAYGVLVTLIFRYPIVLLWNRSYLGPLVMGWIISWRNR